MPDLALRIHYTITFTSAFHIGTGYGLAGQVDATAVRRADGNIYAPGSSVKGRARWHLTGLLGIPWDHDLTPCTPGSGALCSVCNLFGSTRSEPSLFFRDATLIPDDDLAAQARQMNRPSPSPKREEDALEAALRRASQVDYRSQVSISRQRRVAREELLFVTEVGQAGLTFEGFVEGVLPDQGRSLTIAPAIQLPQDTGWLLSALLAVEQLGGRKSRGLGHCQVTISDLQIGQPGQLLTRQVLPADLLRALRQEVPA